MKATLVFSCADSIHTGYHPPTVGWGPQSRRVCVGSASNRSGMSHPSWNDSYASGQLPWDVGHPEPLLVEFVTSRGIRPSRALEIGAGTGTDAIWLAENGFDVLAIDIAPLAVERARSRITSPHLRCQFETCDLLSAPPAGGAFQFVFDRGCFHVLDEADERARFAAQIGATLAPGGLWLSLIGSTEGPPRKVGPPRRSALEVVAAIEPALEILELRSAEFCDGAQAWFCLSRQRTVSAKSSTRH